ncbi:MAG: hypothetical protein JXB19_04740 [Bacteroidales bacterium]|nr:hypothetical protein [Bacteroidales bacterium]
MKRHEEATLERSQTLRDLIQRRIRELRRAGHYDEARSLQRDLDETEIQRNEKQADE